MARPAWTAQCTNRKLIGELLPVRRRESHKGDYGRVLLLCGSEGLTGAARLAAKAALRTGSGLVYLGVPEKIYPIIAAGAGSEIGFPLPCDEAGRLCMAALPAITARLPEMDAVLLGPGLSRPDAGGDAPRGPDARRPSAQGQPDGHYRRFECLCKPYRKPRPRGRRQRRRARREARVASGPAYHAAGGSCRSRMAARLRRRSCGAGAGGVWHGAGGSAAAHSATSAIRVIFVAKKTGASSLHGSHAPVGLLGQTSGPAAADVPHGASAVRRLLVQRRHYGGLRRERRVLHAGLRIFA